MLHRVKEEINILHTVKRRQTNWAGHIMRRNSLLKHVIEGKIEGRIEETGRQARRRKQLLDDLNEKRRYCKLKKRKRPIALCGQLALEGAMDLS
jgi:hypothetical protein